VPTLNEQLPFSEIDLEQLERRNRRAIAYLATRNHLFNIGQTQMPNLHPLLGALKLLRHAAAAACHKYRVFLGMMTRGEIEGANLNKIGRA